MNSESVYLGGEDRPADLEQIASGKVRDIYRLDADRLLFVTTDRISAFDVVMQEGVPHKGVVLTAIAAHWFARTRDIVENHLLSDSVDDVPELSSTWRERLRGRVLIVRECTPDPIEWVVRGHIAGSGWKEYQRSGTVCGIPLPSGLQLAEELPSPLLTPTTKHEDHDRPLTPAQAAQFVGEQHYAAGEKIVMELYARGHKVLAGLGIRLADTKFELGTRDGRVLLIDEALTPDSSRFWAQNQYRMGVSPPSYDKQILRDHLEQLDWNKEYPPPALDAALLERVSDKYLEICERITGSSPVRVES